MTTQEETLLLRIPEVARRLSIARSQAYQLVREGRLPAVRIGKSVRVPRAQLEAWVEARSAGGE